MESHGWKRWKVINPTKIVVNIHPFGPPTGHFGAYYLCLILYLICVFMSISMICLYTFVSIDYIYLYIKYIYSFAHPKKASPLLAPSSHQAAVICPEPSEAYNTTITGILAGEAPSRKVSYCYDR